MARHTRARYIRAKYLTALLPAVLLLGVAVVNLHPAFASSDKLETPSATAKATASSTASNPARDDALNGSYRLERNGWIYVHLEGTPSQVGYQHGYLLAAEIADLLRVEGPFLLHTTKRDWNFYRQTSEQMLWPKIDPEYQQEMDGIAAGVSARGMKVDRWDIVALNALEELPDYYVPWLEKQEGHPAPPGPNEHCSAFVATGAYTKDHKIVMGHNNWTDYVSGSRWNIIFDIKPEHGYSILMDGLPGVIASDDDFGVNSNGIVITETTIGGFEGFDPKGSPEFFRARKALQYSGSIDDYVRIMLDRNNGGYANDWLLADNKTGEIALFELGLKNHKVWRTKDGYFIGSNFPVDPKLAKEETHFDRANPGSSANARRTRWEQLMRQNKGRIDVEMAKQMESDGFDVIAKKRSPDERSLCGCIELSPRGIGDDWGKYFPGGTAQSKVIDSTLAHDMEF
ncbi:MAG TPA: C45 family peptidase, partial [Blastocatellia bacterium]|nr:C45 family peptidase [Blastocatellia bacterium]